jgi:Helix-hairpin-helix domain
MRIRTVHHGRELPFERGRTLVLRRLPAGAVVTRAVLTMAPYSVDSDRRFLETIAFPDAVGDWGASKTVTATAVEIDLRARRRLASLAGSNLDRPLLVDLGGGFLGVDQNGGFGGPGELKVPSGTSALPGLTVTGLRIASTTAPSPDVSLLRVASPPANVTVAIAGGPVFFSRLGELVDPVTTPDFADLLQALLPESDLENGCHLVPFVLHSDSIARLDLTLELDLEVAVDAMPPGLATVQVPYRFDGSPTTAEAQLAVSVPPGMVAVAGGTAGRVQGAFEATRVVHGPVAGAVASAQVRVEAAGPLAQPFLLPQTHVATSVDLLLTAITAEAVVTVDVVDDLDGKPGRASLLPRVAERTVTRVEAGSSTWLNVVLPGEVEIAGGVRRWLVVQVRDGVVTWGASAGLADDAGLQQTRDGGLSWRRAAEPATAGPLAAQFRLRHTNAEFRMPLELRVGSGDSEVAVSLQQFAAQGAIDLDLGFDEVAAAVNTALAGSGGAEPPTAEHVANGDFADWFRVGTDLNGPLELRPEQSGDLVLGPAIAFGPGGGTAYVAGQVGGTMRLVGFDVLCREQLLDSVVGEGQPVRMLVNPNGRHLVLTTLDVGDVGREAASAGPSRIRSRLVLADAATGRTVGVPVQAEEPVFGLVGSSDGAGMFMLGARPGANGPMNSVVRYIGWSDLLAAVSGPAPDWDDHPAGVLPGEPRAIAAGPDGSVLVVTEIVTPGTETEPEARESRLYRYADRASISAGTAPDVPTLDGAVDVAVTADGTSVVVLSRNQMRIVGVPHLRTVATFALMLDDNPLSDARCLALDPAGEIAVLVEAELAAAMVVDLDRRAVTGRPVPLGDLGGDGFAVSVAMSPAGTHAAVTGLGDHADLLLVGAAQPAEWELTAGLVRPHCLPGTGEVLARLAGSGFSLSTSTRGGDTGPVAISQVVPVAGGTRYRFAFDGVASDEGAVAQVTWRGDDCVSTGAELLPVTPFDIGYRTALERVPRHEDVVVAPSGATQAEIRFFTPDGGMLVDHVSLVGTAAAASTATPAAWQPTAPGIAVEASDDGLTIGNGGSVPAAAMQVVAGTAGERYELRATARVAVGTVDAAVELAFADEAGGAVGTTVRVPLDPLDFEDHAAIGLVPDGAVEAEVRVVVPPGGSVQLSALELSVGTPDEVRLRFVSEAPGDLTMTGVVVRLDTAEPFLPPVPPGGLCPSTPAGEDAESCYCPSCGTERPVKHREPVVTDAGRPARVVRCPTCGSRRVRVGGRVVTHVRPIVLPRFRAVDRPPGLTAGARRGPAIVARLHVDVPLVALNGIAEKRAAELRAAGIADVVALAAANPAVLVALPGVSNKMARRLIAEAARLVREQGIRVPF